jgi:hypothetical protein
MLLIKYSKPSPQQRNNELTARTKKNSPSAPSGDQTVKQQARNRLNSLEKRGDGFEILKYKSAFKNVY